MTAALETAAGSAAAIAALRAYVDDQLSTGGGPTAATMRYWQRKAALLDPEAWVFWSPGANQSITVPSDTCWRAANIYGLYVNHAGNPPGVRHYHRRPHVGDAVRLPGGTTLYTGGDGDGGGFAGSGSGAFAYMCKPELVVGVDARYTDDPKGLYHTRVDLLDSLPIEVLAVGANAGAGDGTPATALFSDFSLTFTRAIVVAESAMNVQGMALGHSGHSINLGDEINDEHMNRRSGGEILLPFKRAEFDGIWVEVGSRSGSGSDVAPFNEFGQIIFTVLPSDW